MRKHVLMALMVGCAVIAAGCSNSGKKETEAVKPVETAAARETEEAPAQTEEKKAETQAAKAETEPEAVQTEAVKAETEPETVSAPAASAETEAESEDVFETEPYDYYSAETESETEPIPKPEYNVSDYLVIKDDKYKDIVVEVAAAQKATDEEVDAEIENAFSYLEDYDEVINKITKGKVKEGDTVNIDYTGTRDGKEFDGGSAQDYDLEIGSGSFIEGFEDGLIGKEIGSEVDLNLTFPEDYGVEDLNGADVVFHVKINYVGELPELTDEIAEKLSGGEYTTVKDYVDSVRAEIQAGYDEEYKNNAYGQIMGKLAELYPLDSYPDENIDYYVNNTMAQYIEPYASMYGMSVADFIAAAYNGLSEEEFREQQLIPAAQMNLTQEIILAAIAEKEDITMTDEELDGILQGYADEYGMTVEEILAGTDREVARTNELQQKVMEWLFENVTVKEVEETEGADAFGNETEAETAASAAEAKTAAAETEAETGVAETETETAAKKAGK